MTRSPKVVHLNTTESAAGRSAQALPPILHSVRQDARKRLTDLVQTLFNNTDDALFEMSDRSRNDTDHHMYFDSMREIRLNRSDILKRFGEALYEGFDGLYVAPTSDQQGGGAGEDEGTADTFELLRNDELEISVAISGIVSKVTSRFSLPIMQLTRRIDHICSVRTVTERLNPLGPQKLTDAFVSATSILQIDIRVRIILLKLFERFVMEELAPTYEEANRLLAEAGVLTDLKAALKRDNPRARVTRRSPATEPTAYATTSAIEASGDSGFGMLQRLLANSGSGGAAGSVRADAHTGSAISTTDLMSVLSAVQTDVSSAPLDLDAPPVAVDLRALLLNRAVAVTGQSAGGMDRTDEDTVNLIGMLFDYILNDRNLAIPMKALIARLQIPMLRVAVVDKSFFNRTSHPARQLLNELSSAGIGWSSSAELKRDALYNKIESVVLRVLNNFSEDDKLFEKLVAEIRQFVRNDTRRVQIVEQRIKEAESGKARTIAAKQIVEKLVNQKASGLRLPAEVGRFISDVWSRVLVYICVTQGTDGVDWTDAVATLDDLLWSVQALEQFADVERREDALPHLLDRLEHHMLLINTPDSEIAAHLAALQGRIQEVHEADRAFLRDDHGEVRAGEPPHQHEWPDLPVMEEIVLASADDRAAIEDPEPEPEMVREIHRLTEGVWVEMAGENGESFRCKLATIVQPGNRYIFVNRRGMKVAEKNRMAVAVELKRRTLTVLDESQVFDRALEAVIGNLRQLHQRPASGG